MRWAAVHSAKSTKSSVVDVQGEKCHYLHAARKWADFPKIYSKVAQIFICVVCRRSYCVIAALYHATELIVCRFIISLRCSEGNEVLTVAFHWNYTAEQQPSSHVSQRIKTLIIFHRGYRLFDTKTELLISFNLIGQEAFYPCWSEPNEKRSGVFSAFRFKMMDILLKEQKRRTGALPLQGTAALTWQRLTQQ